MTVEELMKIADNSGVRIYDFPMRELRAVALACGAIAIDRSKLSGDIEYICVAAHELGHVVNNSFYGINSSHREKELAERQANRYAAELLLPLSELLLVMHSGILFAHILARMYDVTREFAEMVLELYDQELRSAASVWSAAKNSRYTNYGEMSI